VTVAANHNLGNSNKNGIARLGSIWAGMPGAERHRAAGNVGLGCTGQREQRGERKDTTCYKS